MQMIILLFKQHIYQCKHNNCAYQINPMRYDRIRTQVHKAKRNHQLQQRIETRNLNVTYLQLIRHKLVHMLTMRLTKIFMQQNTMHNSQAAIHTIYEKEDQEGYISSCEYKITNQKQKYICNPD